MAQVALTPIKVTSASIVETLGAANTGSYPSDGNKFANTTTTVLTVKNGDGSSHTMTVSWLRDGVVVTRTQAIAAGVTRRFHFNPSEYGSVVNIHFDAITSITVGVHYV